MKQIVVENIRQMDLALGGGIQSEKIRIDTINHPVLVIGLGGTGTDALLRLKHQVNRRFKLPENNITKQKRAKPDNIEFLSIETNEHDRKRYRGMSLDYNAEVVLLSNAGIGSILNNRSTLPSYISSWLSPGLTITDGTKGASGNRQAGRLLLFEKINTAIDAIENKIRTLRLDQENKLLVYILSGLSGGTGGGMFLDIAYIVRGIMEREYGSNGIDKVEIGGYLFTPDVNLAGNGLNIHTAEYIQRNGYAALKELDYWMNIEERQGDRFCQKYGTRLEVKSALAPFNLCHLISASNVDGVHIKGAYDYCMNVTAENIVNFLALEEKESGQEFAVQDYYSNLLSNIATMKTSLPQGMQHSANFVYNIIGASAAVLPSGGIGAYLAHLLIKRIGAIFTNQPTEHEVNQFMQEAKLDISAMAAELMRDLPPIKLDFVGTDYFSHHNVIKTSRVDIEEKLNEQYNTARRELLKRGEVKEFALQPVLTGLATAFCDHQRGPIYATKLIADDGTINIISRLHAYGQQVKEKITSTAEEIDMLELAAQDRLDEARRAIFLTKESKKNAYIEAKMAVCRVKLRRECLVILAAIYSDLAIAVERENDKVYSVYADVLQETQKVLHSNALFLLEQKVQDGNQKLYDWNVLDVPDCAEELEEQVLAINANSLTHDFLKTIFDQRTSFLSDNQPDIAGAISDFVYDRFSGVVSRTMSNYLAAKYGDERIIEHIVEAEVAPRLFRDAKPVFNLDNIAGVFNFPSYGVVSVPWNTPEIVRGIEAYQQHALSNLRFNIRKSTITDRIFWLNTQNGVPLFAYTPLKVYEELYERTINTREGIGRHLVMCEHENWVNLPSPIPENLWGDTYSNPRQKERNNHARNVFRTAISNGVISVVDSKYVCLSGDQHATTIYCTTNEKEAEAHFVRNVKLVFVVEAENKKKQKKLEAEAVSAEGEKDNIGAFLRALACEAIVKRGVNYVYEKELDEDPWPSFVNLVEDAEYPEYAMYKNYSLMPIMRQRVLAAKARKHAETWPADKLLVSMQKWQGKIALRKNQLDTDARLHADGARMYEFYKDMLKKANAQVNTLLLP